MKFIAAILAIITLAMPVQITLAGLNCMVAHVEIEKASASSCKKMEGCGSHKTKHEKKAKGKDCDKRNCPFEVCCCCSYTIIERQVINAPYTILPTEKKRLVNDRILSNFIADCWHPPKFV